MTYREFRDLFRGMGQGIDEILRQPLKEGDLVVIGRRQDVVIPFSFPGRPVLLPKGDDTVLEDEEIQSHCREINRILGRPEDSGC